jgi:hypothetical protein
MIVTQGKINKLMGVFLIRPSFIIKLLVEPVTELAKKLHAK